MLKPEEIHFFNDIAYYHVPFTHCPTGEKTRTELRCHCNPKDNFDWKGYSCKFVVRFRWCMRLLTMSRHVEVLRGQRHGKAGRLGESAGLKTI
jgi:hypothetical protein